MICQFHEFFNLIFGGFFCCLAQMCCVEPPPPVHWAPLIALCNDLSMVRLLKAAAEAEAVVSGSAAPARRARVTATNGALSKGGRRRRL